MEKKKHKAMSLEEKAEYHRIWYAKKTAKANPDLHITMHNISEDLKLAILAAIQGSK